MSASEVHFFYGAKSDDIDGARRVDEQDEPDDFGNDPEVERPKLSYVQFQPGDHDWRWPTTGWALQAAVVAALGALFIGIGIAILLTFA